MNIEFHKRTFLKSGGFFYCRNIVLDRFDSSQPFEMAFEPVILGLHLIVPPKPGKAASNSLPSNRA